MCFISYCQFHDTSIVTRKDKITEAFRSTQNNSAYVPALTFRLPCKTQTRCVFGSEKTQKASVVRIRSPTYFYGRNPCTFIRTRSFRKYHLVFTPIYFQCMLILRFFFLVKGLTRPMCGVLVVHD